MSDSQVKQKSQNYHKCPTESLTKIMYSNIIRDIYTLYSQHDI